MGSRSKAPCPGAPATGNDTTTRCWWGGSGEGITEPAGPVRTGVHEPWLTWGPELGSRIRKPCRDGVGQGRRQILLLPGKVLWRKWGRLNSILRRVRDSWEMLQGHRFQEGHRGGSRRLRALLGAASGSRGSLQAWEAGDLRCHLQVGAVPASNQGSALLVLYPNGSGEPLTEPCWGASLLASRNRRVWVTRLTRPGSAPSASPHGPLRGEGVAVDLVGFCTLPEWALVF